ncbi:hypothetical protein EJ06DRAFT_585508 [Trichodelitschia bisporula]|uniref:Conidiation protein 6 n=1 Tax=Trichodelitschia bisporula TaxID=703511 RepID=A0A6G1HJC7_9PEZI|nr:hypothetical protein EJ06DRAFT_585508 [Trichodelitschia bisporula]
MANPGNVIGGYKATISNPTVSNQAKEHAKEVLEEEYNIPVAEGTRRPSQTAITNEAVEGKNPGNVVGGYKATIHNPRVSESAKEHARETLDAMGVEPPED